MLSAAAVEWLEDRGLDHETVLQYGAESRNPRGVSSGEWLALPFVRDDKPVNWEYRCLEPKAFRRDTGGVMCFWNEAVLDDAGLADQPLIITEGIIDALSVIAAGFPRVVSMPNGSQSQETADAEKRAARYKFIDDVRGKLDRIARIIIAADADSKGYALTEDLSAILGAARCKFTPYPDGCKDANDVLVRFGVGKLKQCIEGARWVNVAGVRKLSDYPPGSDGDPIVWRSGIGGDFDRRVGLMPGYTSIWTGIPNHGKTQLLKQVTWSLCETMGIRAAVGSFEETFNRDYRRSALQYLIGRPRTGWSSLGGPWTDEEVKQAADWIDEHIVAIDPHGYGQKGQALEEFDPTLDWVLDAATTAIVRHGCRFIVIDPWGEIIQQRERWESEHDFVGRALSRFNRMARILKAHVAIVAHPRKMESDRNGEMKIPGAYDISGSSYFYNKPSLGVTIHREPERDRVTKEPMPNSTRTRVRVWKSKFQDVQGKPGDCFLFYDRQRARFEEN